MRLWLSLFIYTVICIASNWSWASEAVRCEKALLTTTTWNDSFHQTLVGNGLPESGLQFRSHMMSGWTPPGQIMGPRRSLISSMDPSNPLQKNPQQNIDFDHLGINVALETYDYGYAGRMNRKLIQSIWEAEVKVGEENIDYAVVIDPTVRRTGLAAEKQQAGEYTPFVGMIRVYQGRKKLQGDGYLPTVAMLQTQGRRSEVLDSIDPNQPSFELGKFKIDAGSNKRDRVRKLLDLYLLKEWAEKYPEGRFFASAATLTHVRHYEKTFGFKPVETIENFMQVQNGLQVVDGKLVQPGTETINIYILEVSGADLAKVIRANHGL